MIEILTQPDSTITCTPVGPLDVHGAIQLRHVIADLAEPGIDVEIDLRLAADVESIGISALVGALRLVHSLGGRASVTHASPMVRWFLDRLFVEGPTTGESVGPSDAA